jgi:hypothetical protein
MKPGILLGICAKVRFHSVSLKEELIKACGHQPFRDLYSHSLNQIISTSNEKEEQF